MPGYGLGYSSLVSRTPFVSGAGFDPDAQAFFTAANITDPTQQTAVNQLVVDLKGYGIWSKMKALYPFVGGTATTHKYNLKDPQDTNAAFRLTFAGGWTHSSTGATPNGTNGYANTFLIPSTQLTSDNHHISLYSRTNISGEIYDIGSGDDVGSYLLDLYLRRSGDTAGYDAGYYTTNRNTFSNNNSTGHFIGSTIVNTESKYYKNGINQNTKSINSGFLVLPSGNIYLGGFNEYTSSTIYFSSKQIAFSSIGDGLDDTEAANFYTAVQTFQTTLSRNV